MKILAIDTSNIPLSVAVLDGNNLLGQTTINVGRKHSVALMPIVADLLKRSRLEAEDIDRFVVAQGPGSYTGLRIGVTTAKTFASTLNKELVGVSSLKLLAANYPSTTERILVPVFDARRGNVFAAAYQYQAGKQTEFLPDQHISFADLCAALKEKDAKVIFVGADAAHFADDLKDSGLDYMISEAKYNYPQAFVLGLLGAEGKPAEIDSFVPNYHRLTQAEIQWHQSHPEKEHRPYVERY